ncbi:MAG TPA: hypothetical protein VF310_10005 [Vicinamibacteria bacterium]
MSDEAYRRYVHLNLPHARTLIQRIGRSLEALGAFGESRGVISASSGLGGAAGLHQAYEELEREARPFDDDPPFEQALAAADAIAVKGRALVAAIVVTPARGDRLGQSVRNLFECLGLADEGAQLSVKCGERPDSPLR